MEKLIVGFAPQGYMVTFGLSLANMEIIKERFPNARPITKVTVGFKDVKTTLEPYRESIMKYVLPLLTGLDKEQLGFFKEISFFNYTKNREFLKITQQKPEPHVEKV